LKNGINLATHPLRGRDGIFAAIVMLVLLALAASAAHVAWALRARGAIVELTDELVRIDDRHSRLAGQLDAFRERVSAPSARNILRELLAIHESGTARSTPPAEVLGELARAFPRDAIALSVEIVSLPSEQTLTLEVVADSTSAAASLLSGLSQSPLLADAEILDERHHVDGGIFMRIGAKIGVAGVVE
jgi:hypothetical protein